MNLTQQLEDKKKELIILNECCSQDKNNTEGILKAEIAILEQAIAEIDDLCNKLFEKDLLLQKQRQEILKLIKQEISKDAYSYTFECRLNNFLKNGLKKQLNQPKTEQ